MGCLYDICIDFLAETLLQIYVIFALNALNSLNSIELLILDFESHSNKLLFKDIRSVFEKSQYEGSPYSYLSTNMYSWSHFIQKITLTCF